MKAFARIKPLYFFVSLAIGLFCVYVLSPPPQVVVKFPSPYNAGHITYRDPADQCYTYKAEKLDCPKDKGAIKPQPVGI